MNDFYKGYLRIYRGIAILVLGFIFMTISLIFAGLFFQTITGVISTLFYLFFIVFFSLILLSSRPKKIKESYLSQIKNIHKIPLSDVSVVNRIISFSINDEKFKFKIDMCSKQTKNLQLFCDKIKPKDTVFIYEFNNTDDFVFFNIPYRYLRKK